MMKRWQYLTRSLLIGAGLFVSVALVMPACQRDSASPTDGVAADSELSWPWPDNDTPAGDDRLPADIVGPADVAPGSDSDMAASPPRWTRQWLGADADLHALWCSQDGRCLAVGSGGTILESWGAGFVPHASGTSVDLFGICGFADGSALAVGAGGTALFFDGQRWQTEATGAVADLYAVWGVSAADALAVGAAGTAIARMGRDQWQPEATLTDIDLYAVWGDDSGERWVGGQNGMVLHKLGALWLAAQITAPSATVHGIWGTPDGRTIVAVASDGHLVRKTEDGWRAETSNDPDLRDLFAVWGLPSGLVYAVGRDGVLLGWDGSHWNLQTVAGPTFAHATLYGIAGYQDDDGLKVRMVGTDGAVLVKSGMTFIDGSAAPTQTLHALWGAGADDIWTVGDEGLILHGDGSQWQRVPAPDTEADLLALWGRRSTDVWAVGRAGTVLHGDGLQWVALPRATTVDLYAVRGQGVNVFAVGDQGTVLAWDGSVWTLLQTGVIERLTAVWADSENLWVVGQAATVLRRSADRWRAETVPTAVDLHALWAQDDLLLAAGDHGVLLARDASGVWRLLYESPGDFCYGLYGYENQWWAVGWAGLVLHSDAAGTLTAESTGTALPLQTVWGWPQGPLWAAGQAGVLLRREP